MYVVIDYVCYDISRNIMFNTNSQVTVVSYMYCYITISLNLISKVSRVTKADRLHRGCSCTRKATSQSPKQQKMAKLQGAVEEMSLEVLIT